MYGCSTLITVSLVLCSWDVLDKYAAVTWLDTIHPFLGGKWSLPII
jgi:hypothetical protein